MGEEQIKSTSVPLMEQNRTESILNVMVSRFNNYHTPNDPEPIVLLDWLRSDDYKEKVERIRAIADKAERDKAKALLPAITPSALVSYRNGKSESVHSGFLQFDIDLKDNQHIDNYNQLKQELGKIKNVAYCGLSVSGLGCWGLIPIAYPDKHTLHFKALSKALVGFGINLDPAPKNIVSLRGYSYDPDAYFNHQAIPLQKYEAPPPPPKATYAANPTADQAKVEACLAQIVDRRIDLTGSYKDWFNLGCSLARTFGETGRNYFHTLSQYHPDYDTDKTDKEYNKCLKYHEYDFKIDLFLSRCATAGIRYKKPESEDAVKPVRAQPAKASLISKQATASQSNTHQPDNWMQEIEALHQHFDTREIPVAIEIKGEQRETEEYLIEQFKAALASPGLPTGRLCLDRLYQLKQILTSN